MATNTLTEFADELRSSGFTVKHSTRSANLSRDGAGLREPAGHCLGSYRLVLIPSPDTHAEHPSTKLVVESLVMAPLARKQFLMDLPDELGSLWFSREDNSVQFGEVRIDFDAMEVRRSERLVDFTALEFKVLAFFVFNPNKVVSRDDLLNQVWGYNCYPSTRTVDNLILKLRKKLEADASSPLHFRTIHGVGYKFVP
jgi:hypothetical protein